MTIKKLPLCHSPLLDGGSRPEQAEGFACRGGRQSWRQTSVPPSQTVQPFLQPPRPSVRLLLPKARGQECFAQGHRMRATNTDHWHPNQAGDAGSKTFLPSVPGTPRRCHLLRSLFLAILRGFDLKESACASPSLARGSACYLGTSRAHAAELSSRSSTLGHSTCINLPTPQKSSDPL